LYNLQIMLERGARQDLQRGEHGLWLRDTVVKRLGRLGTRHLKDIYGGDTPDTLWQVSWAVQKRLTDVWSLRELVPPRLSRLYGNKMTTTAMTNHRAQVDEGMQTSIAFPTNLCMALIHATENGDEGLGDYSVRKPSDALGQRWFTDMLLKASDTGNGFWSGASTKTDHTPGEAYRSFTRKTNGYGTLPEQSSPFSLNEYGNPVFSDSLQDGLLYNLRSYHRSSPNTRSSGCPVAHTSYRPVGEKFQYIGPNQITSAGTEDTKPVIEVGVSGIELCADALAKSYQYVLHRSGVPVQII
jgi:hypothetical protein